MRVSSGKQPFGRTILAIGAALSLLCLASPAAAATLTLSDGADNTLTDNPMFPIWMQPGNLIIGNSPGTNFHAFMEFDVSPLAALGAPGDIMVSSAILTVRLGQFNINNNMLLTQVRGYVGDGLVEFADLAGPTTLLDTYVFDYNQSPYSADVTDFLQQILDNDDPHLGIHLRRDTLGVSGNYGILRFGQTNEPQIAVTYSVVPEPASSALLGLGIAALAARRRRRP
jgi:hypothetical protein